MYILTFCGKRLVGIHSINEEENTQTHIVLQNEHKCCSVIPLFLSAPIFDHASNYNLRSSHSLRPVTTRTNLYYNWVLPSVIRDWNELPVVVRQLDSVSSF